MPDFDVAESAPLEARCVRTRDRSGRRRLGEHRHAVREAAVGTDQAEAIQLLAKRLATHAADPRVAEALTRAVREQAANTIGLLVAMQVVAAGAPREARPAARVAEGVALQARLDQGEGHHAAASVDGRAVRQARTRGLGARDLRNATADREVPVHATLGWADAGYYRGIPAANEQLLLRVGSDEVSGFEWGDARGDLLRDLQGRARGQGLREGVLRDGRVANGSTAPPSEECPFRASVG